MNGHIAVFLIVIYMTFCFTYSIIEKISQWKKCKEYYSLHFKETFLKNHVPASIVMVIVLEILSVGINVYGLYILYAHGNVQFVLLGLVTMAISLLLLMTGQRIAQDYSGAMNITVYFILTVIGIFLIENF